jgi:hypothetical protein
MPPGPPSPPGTQPPTGPTPGAGPTYGYPQGAGGQPPGPYNQQPGPYGTPGPYGGQGPHGAHGQNAQGPYGGQQNPYAQQPTPHPQQPHPYGGGQPNPYGQQGSYGQQSGAYGQQPGPYGGQPNPYGQQPGAYGGQGQQQFPGAPTPPPAGGGGGKSFFRSRAGAVLAAAVAALLVIGGGTWYALSGNDSGKKPIAHQSDDPKPKPTASPGVDEGDGSGGNGSSENTDLNAGRKPGDSKVLWLGTNDVDLPHDGANVFGPWLVGNTLVKAMYKQVVGYSATTGKKVWTLPLANPLCAAPNAPTADGKIVIAYKDGVSDKSECKELQEIDLTTGKGGWNKVVPEFGTFDFLSDIALTISGNTLTVGRTGHSDAFRVSDGKTLFGTIAGNCQPFSFAGGTKLIAAESCPSADSSVDIQQLQELDPVTGKAKWTFKIKKGYTVDKVYSVDPLVVSFKDDDKKLWSVEALNNDGTRRSAIQGGKDNFQVECGNSFAIFGEQLEGCKGVAADANTLYIETRPDDSAETPTNAVIAFDLATGKQKWRSAAPAGRQMVPLQMAGGNVVVYEPATSLKGGVIATLAPTGGAPKTIQKHPDSTAEIESSFLSPRYLYASGMFYLANYNIFADTDAEELKTKTIMAFGN